MTICWWVDPLGEACDWSWGWTARAGRWMVWQARWCQQLSARSEPWIFLDHLQIYRSVKLPTSPRVVGRTSHVCHLLGAPLGTLATLATHFAKDTTSLGQQPRASTRVNDLIPWNIWFLEWAAAKTSICKSCAKLFHKAFHEAFKLLALKSFNMFQCWPSLCYPFGIPSVFVQWIPSLNSAKAIGCQIPESFREARPCAGSNRMIPMMHQI